MPITKTLRICVAYESGFGKGKNGDTDTNPYNLNTEEYEAWDIGFKEGSKCKQEIEKNPITLADRFHSLTFNEKDELFDRFKIRLVGSSENGPGKILAPRDDIFKLCDELHRVPDEVVTFAKLNFPNGFPEPLLHQDAPAPGRDISCNRGIHTFIPKMKYTKDKDGYYNVVLFDSNHSINKYDLASIVECLNDSTSNFNRRLRTGLLQGMLCTDVPPFNEYTELIEVKVNLISHVIKDITYVYSGSSLVINGKIKPTGNYGPILEGIINRDGTPKFGLLGVGRLVKNMDDTDLFYMQAIYNFHCTSIDM